MFRRKSKEFLHLYITVDETWIHHYTPKSKQQSAQWIPKSGSAPKRPKTQQSAGKVLATVFWNAHGIILINYPEKGRTITGENYASLLDRLNDEIKKKRPHLTKKKILFYQDIAPAHKSIKAMAKLNEFLLHPPYFPDLAPCNFYLFPNLKRWLQGKRFAPNEEVESETDAYFGGL
ncbi:histone-lysine N-methyltransferase SETMAR-like [Odontomachus brunneus]|uniref:histone-lysine N-methyltransferase SETMAR-like n=1 Tax=Odontomachus brunneus TaxID=486640 RepID=UPI0013F26CE7|nr:histone-lysine N-methyltransferase SETMAR-like [Odontomachus brunneus]